MIFRGRIESGGSKHQPEGTKNDTEIDIYIYMRERQIHVHLCHSYVLCIDSPLGGFPKVLFSFGGPEN